MKKCKTNLLSLEILELFSLGMQYFRLESGEYGIPLNDNICFQKFFDHFMDSYSISQTVAKDWSRKKELISIFN